MTIKPLLKKDFALIQESPSATIINEKGKFIIHTDDTARSYLFSLILNKDKIVYDALNGYYNFKTSDISKFNDDAKRYNFYLNDNIKQGNDGNISLSYISSSKDNKILNKDMFEIVDVAEVSIILEKDQDKFFIDITSRTDWDFFLTNILSSGYVPIRFYFKNITLVETGLFYLKIVNAKLNKIYDELIHSFSTSNNLTKMSGVDLRSYGIEISEHINKNAGLSNQRYLVKLTDNKVTKVYVIKKYHLLFPYRGADLNYDNESLVCNLYTSNSNLVEILNVLKLYSDKNGNTTDEKSFFLNNEQSIINNSFNGLIKASNDIKLASNLKSFFIRKERDTIKESFQALIKTSSEVILNKSDQHYLEKLKNFDKKIFHMSEGYVRILPKDECNTLVNLYNRDDFKLNKIDNFDTQTKWFKSTNELSFEREKVLSVMFIEEYVEKLKNSGHIDIEIFLEHPVNKKEGGKGYIDFIIKSTKNNITYGQSFEFKAIFNYGGQSKINSELQAENYDIQKLIDNYNIRESYDGHNHTKVILYNLIDYYK